MPVHVFVLVLKMAVLAAGTEQSLVLVATDQMKNVSFAY
jgi:hypothetical protein